MKSRSIGVLVQQKCALVSRTAGSPRTWAPEPGKAPRVAPKDAKGKAKAPDVPKFDATTIESARRFARASENQSMDTVLTGLAVRVPKETRKGQAPEALKFDHD